MLGADLRRKHIQTLEVCQRLADENARLRDGALDAQQQVTDPSIFLEEVQRLQEQVEKLSEKSSGLEQRCKTSEQRCASLVLEVESEREVHQVKMGKLEDRLEESQGIAERLKQELALLRHSRQPPDDSAPAQPSEQCPRNECTRLRSQAAVDAAARAALASDVASAGARLRSEVERLGALLSAQSKLTAEAEAQACGAVAAAEGARGEADAARRAKIAEAREVKRLRAQNAALENEVRRLSLGAQQQAQLQVHLQAQQQRAPPPPVDEPSSRANEADEPPPEAYAEASPGRGGPSGVPGPRSSAQAAATTVAAAQERNFAVFASLRRENQQLRAQLEATRLHHARTMGATTRKANSALGPAVPGRR